jgi:hypothetical protein
MQVPGNKGHLQALGREPEGQTVGDVAFVVSMTVLSTLALFGVIHLFVEGKGWHWERRAGRGGGGGQSIRRGAQTRIERDQ